MKHKLSCEQISALINFYFEGTLSPTLTRYVQEHIENCKSCCEKYCQIPDTIVPDNKIDNPYFSKQYEAFKKNLSAYVDNELNDLDNIKIKKFVISNPLARQDLENIYSFKKMLHSSFEKTKNDFKTDFSKSIINNIKQSGDNKIDPFFKIAATFAAMLCLIVAGIIKILYL